VYKDEIIQCPECELDIARSTKDQYRKDPITSANFQAIGLVKIGPHVEMRCPECRTQYGKRIGFGIQMHVKNVGWSSGLERK
jgi:hypothetical protein